MNSVLGDKKAVAILLGPALLVYTAVMLVPVFWSMGYAAFEGNAIRGFNYVGLQNLAGLLGDEGVHDATWFTIRYAVAMTVLQIGLGYALALMYVFWLRRGSTLVRTLVFFPVILPTVAVALMFRRLFEAAPTTGPVNSLLEAMGIGAVDWFGASASAFWVIIIMDLWRSMGFYAVLLFAGLLDIPEDVMESARLDGASGWRLIRHIVVPLSLPVLLSSVIFSINGTLKVFDSVLALTNGGPGDASTPLTLLMFRTSFQYGDYGYGSSIALLLTAICLVFTVFVFKATRRDLTEATR